MASKIHPSCYFELILWSCYPGSKVLLSFHHSLNTQHSQIVRGILIPGTTKLKSIFITLHLSAFFKGRQAPAVQLSVLKFHR